jgi:hypothetical protein
MIPIPSDPPWSKALFTADVPVDIILRIAHMIFTGPSTDENQKPEQATLDRTILGMIAVEAFRRGADYREVPWPMRLEHVRLTGQPEGKRPQRPQTPETE